MSIGNDDLGYIFTFFLVLKRRSAVFSFTKEAGLSISTVALKSDLFTLRVTWRRLIFPDGVFITSGFFIEINLGTDIMCFAGDECSLGETFGIGCW